MTPSLDLAITNAAARALTRRATALREQARQGTALSAKGNSVIRSPEAALAERMAAGLDEIAAEVRAMEGML